MLEPDALRGARPDLRGESMSKHRFLPGIVNLLKHTRVKKRLNTSLHTLAQFPLN